MGKIPARPDFVRHQAGDPEIKILDQWIYEGIAYLARRFPSDWKERIESFSNISCYIGGEGAVPDLCGVICPSHDKSGRQHPYVDFATCASTYVMQTLPYIALRFSDFYTQSCRLQDETGAELDMDALIQQGQMLGSLIPPFETERFVKLRNQCWLEKTSAEFWDKILPGSSDIARLNFARDVLQTLKMAANRGPERIAWGIRLPICGGEASDAFVSFWLSLLTGVLGHYKWRPHIFWNPQNKSSSSLTVYFRSPNASSFAQLICPEVDEGGVVDVVRRPLENLPEITSMNLKTLVENDSLTWPKMLENWLKGGEHERSN
jgi:type VI secretion system protein ImpM